MICIAKDIESYSADKAEQRKNNSLSLNFSSVQWDQKQKLFFFSFYLLWLTHTYILCYDFPYLAILLCCFNAIWFRDWGHFFFVGVLASKKSLDCLHLKAMESCQKSILKPFLGKRYLFPLICNSGINNEIQLVSIVWKFAKEVRLLIVDAMVQQIYKSCCNCTTSVLKGQKKKKKKSKQKVSFEFVNYT